MLMKSVINSSLCCRFLYCMCNQMWPSLGFTAINELRARAPGSRRSAAPLGARRGRQPRRWLWSLGPRRPHEPRAAPGVPSSSRALRDRPRPKRPVGCRVPRSGDSLGARAGGRRNSAQTLQQFVASKLSPECLLEKLQNCSSPVRTCFLSSSLFLSIRKLQTAGLRVMDEEAFSTGGRQTMYSPGTFMSSNCQALPPEDKMVRQVDIIPAHVELTVQCGRQAVIRCATTS
nr:PREDICTED: uncharacterized protein LOC103561783 [Equus przewalskii]